MDKGKQNASRKIVFEGFDSVKSGAERFHMKKQVVESLLVPGLVALVITGLTFFVGEGVVAGIPGGYGAGTATVYGFPMTFITNFPCCSAGGGPGYSYALNNTSFYHPLGFVGDFALWLVISLAIAASVSSFTVVAVIAALIIGTTATLLLSSFLAPLPTVAATPALEAVNFTQTGYPYEYLVCASSGFPAASAQLSCQFSLPPALADFVLWVSTSVAIAGISVKVSRPTSKGKSSNSRSR